MVDSDSSNEFENVQDNNDIMGDLGKPRVTVMQKQETFM
jgi:hypothetical protein